VAQTVRDQIRELEELIERAQGARQFFAHALMCPAEHPAHECPHMIETLDQLLTGTPFEHLAAKQMEPGARP
jgi:hypothetical protein